jgi:hypoxanthine phosphoribosyltransferase
MARSALLAPPTRPPQEGNTSPPRFAHDSEAEFARILTFYGITWHYEPRSFPLRESEDGQLLEAFTPDFYLPDYDQYIELTTLRQSLATYKNRKLRLMRERYPEVNVKLLNRRDVFTLLAKFGIDPRGSGAVPHVDQVLFSEEQIARRVRELGEQISEDYAGRELVLVGVLRGVACFMADLMRAISIPVRVDFLALSPYQAEGGTLRFTKSLEEPVAGKDVLVVEDVVDTGMSLHRLLQYLARREPADVRVCTLLDKRAHRLVDLPIDYTGFAIGEEFVVGYGLDYQQQYRNLPFIATLQRPA